MMKKLAFILIIMTVTPLLAFAMQADWGNKDFSETMQTDLEDINKIKLSLPDNSSYNSTTDNTKIQTFIDYMNQRDFKEIRGNEPAYLPMRASMIYLYGHDQEDFVVSFGDKVMISHTFYDVSNGNIETDFLTEFYNSLE